MIQLRIKPCCCDCPHVDLAVTSSYMYEDNKKAVTDEVVGCTHACVCKDFEDSMAEPLTDLYELFSEYYGWPHGNYGGIEDE